MNHPTSIQLRRTAHEYRERAIEVSKWVYLNPQNAATWRKEAAKLRALAAAAEVDLQILRHHTS